MAPGKSWIRCTLVFAALLLVPALLAAQTISGVVTDTSNAVVPGVTVEASSPALIERTRAVVTDASGRYSIINLRPGTYTVTFSLSGFKIVRREGLVLTSDFTAQVNATLSAGDVEETVTVSAEAPVVDVQSVATPRVMTRETMDAIPTSGRTPNDLMATIPGVTPGLFGQTFFHGSQDSLTMVDGMRVTQLIGAGPSLTTASTSSNTYQEYSYSTAIDSAEFGQPGMRVNLISRDGGNTFHGSLFTNYTRDGWQTTNLDAALKAQGLRDPAKTYKLLDVNPTIGGPIVRDTLWFQTTYQRNDSRVQMIGSYFDADPSPFSYSPDESRPGISASSGNSFTQRLTWQVNARDKVAASYDYNKVVTPYFPNPIVLASPPPEATVGLISGPAQNFRIRWTRTHTSKLLFEGSFVRAVKNGPDNNYRDAAAPWSARNVNSLPPAPPTLYAIINQSTNRNIGVANFSDANDSRSMEFRGSATYVTGSHNLKVGFSAFTGWGSRATSVIGNVVMTYAGTPLRPFQIAPTLPTNMRNDITGDWAVFAQDRWTVKRLTVNAGLRLDLLNSAVPEQTLPGTVWLPEQKFPAKDVLHWRDLSPRLGFVYDVFGDGKTAVKAAVARYVAGETVGTTNQNNPQALMATTDTRLWNDLNGDHTIYNADGSLQLIELGPSQNRNFGKAVATTTPDADILGGWFHRGYSWETNASVQHELVPRVSVTGTFYRRSVGNQTALDNLLISPTDFSGPFCIQAPTDSRLPDSGQQVCGLYDLNPSSLGLVGNRRAFAKNLGSGKGIKDITTGYDLTTNARLGDGVFLQGGLNWQKTLLENCDVIDSPQTLYCSVESKYVPNLSFTGSYRMPYDVQISGVYQGLAGPPIAATYNANNLAVIGLGRPLSTGTKAVPLIEPNQDYVSMRHIFNMRFTRIFTARQVRIQPMADLYNIFNTNAITGINTTYGGNWMRPTGIVSPRQFRLSVQLDF